MLKCFETPMIHMSTSPVAMVALVLFHDLLGRQQSLIVQTQPRQSDVIWSACTTAWRRLACAPAARRQLCLPSYPRLLLDVNGVLQGPLFARKSSEQWHAGLPHYCEVALLEAVICSAPDLAGVLHNDMHVHDRLDAVTALPWQLEA